SGAKVIELAGLDNLELTKQRTQGFDDARCSRARWHPGGTPRARERAGESHGGRDLARECGELRRGGDADGPAACHAR
ncbi:hypothetical protein ACWGDB_26310, partial [Streptomyces sp. NPDC055013]